MITLRPVGMRGLGASCYPCGDLSGRSPGITGLRGLGKGALGVLGRLGDGPSPEEIAAETGGAPPPGMSYDEFNRWREENRTVFYIGLGVGALGAGLSGYHGYKRSGGSVGSALGWGLLGGLFPIITVPVALAQGFGKRKGR